MLDLAQPSLITKTIVPELPEVQTTVNGINAKTKGLRIVDVWTDYASAHYASKPEVKNPRYFPKFKKDILGAKIVKAERKAKNILISLSNGATLLIHMKMTGHILYGTYAKTKSAKDPWKPVDSNETLKDPFNRHIHFVLTLSNGKHLVLSDMRKFAKITLIPKGKDVPELTTLGPDPLAKDFSPSTLKAQLLKRPRANIKQALMDQKLLSGIGNIYSDEILFASGIHPLSKVECLTAKDFQNLYRHTKAILAQGINFGGDSTSDYRNLDGKRGAFHYHHRAYRETGKPCQKRGCAGTIQRIVIGGRSAHFCPVHQKQL